MSDKPAPYRPETRFAVRQWFNNAWFHLCDFGSRARADIFARDNGERMGRHMRVVESRERVVASYTPQDWAKPGRWRKRK